MTTSHAKRPVRARPGLRPASRPPRQPPSVPGDERSKAKGKGRDARHAHDKDGNVEAARELENANKRR
jgi:hypothetical protein